MGVKKGRERLPRKVYEKELFRLQAELVKLQSERADRAEEASRQALTAYLDDPFRPVEPPPGRLARLRAKLG